MRAQTEEQLFDQVCDILVDNEQYLLAWIGIVKNDNEKNVVPIAHSGFKEGYVEHLTIHAKNDKFGKGPTGLAFRTGKVQVNQDVHNNPYYVPWRKRALTFGYQSSIALPCKSNNHILFVLNIYAAEPNAFDKQEIELLELLSKDIAYGINHLRTTTERNTDKLTSIPNRRYFDEVLEIEWRRAMRYSTPITMLMIDIDFFKLYNDYYGHLAGDDCLQKIAKFLFSTVYRPADLVARFGGEEFVIVLPNSDTSAITLAEKCRLSIENLKIRHKMSTISDFVTVSIGISTIIPRKGSISKNIIIKADKALYKAKGAGRNRTVQIS